jgi:cellulose synthase/poly-beta-1,6-N-acetylglucosamine synthase-like glycosyltransferase
MVKNLSFSIIVTSYGEPKTLDKAIESLVGQKLPGRAEILIVSPDRHAAALATKFNSLALPVRHLPDQGRGKPAALNVGLTHAKGDIAILTDGDVYVGQNSLIPLVEPFSDQSVGAVSGHPVSLNPKDIMLGYWSHFLTDEAAHNLRRQRAKNKQFLECSGYLFAYRRQLVGKIPEDALAEDALISLRVWRKGYKIAYAPEAEVFVKFPTNLADWQAQKLRTIAAYSQPYLKNAPVIRSFFKESYYGIWRALRYARNLRELYWTKILFAMRIYVWLAAWWEINIRKTPLNQIWKRVESTK